MWLIVGLGNPGEKYQNTRHNLGFKFVEGLRLKLNGPLWEKSSKFKAETSKLTDEVMLVKPLTFMNNSGESVTLIANFFKIPSEGIVIVYDELDLPLGHIKLRLGGSAAGHHGVESVIEKLGTDKFIRVRLGIGKSNIGHNSSERFVLEKFSASEQPAVKKIIKRAINAVELILKEGIDQSQNQFN